MTTYEVSVNSVYACKIVPFSNGTRLEKLLESARFEKGGAKPVPFWGGGSVLLGWVLDLNILGLNLGLSSLLKGRLRRCWLTRSIYCFCPSGPVDLLDHCWYRRLWRRVNSHAARWVRACSDDDPCGGIFLKKGIKLAQNLRGLWGKENWCWCAVKRKVYLENRFNLRRECIEKLPWHQDFSVVRCKK